jgi:hypothetical protein
MKSVAELVKFIITNIYDITFYVTVMMYINTEVFY